MIFIPLTQTLFILLWQALVTDAPIPNVGALAERLQAKRDAEKAAAREERQKRYGHVRPLGRPLAKGSLARTIQDPSPSVPAFFSLPVDLLSLDENPALSLEQPHTLASIAVEEEWAPLSSPAGQPLAAEDSAAPATQRPTSPSLVLPRELRPSTEHPARDSSFQLLAEEVAAASEDQPLEPRVPAPPLIGDTQLEVIPSQPPSAALPLSPAVEEQTPPPVPAAQPSAAHQNLAALDASQPPAVEPSTETLSALPPMEPLVEPPASVESIDKEQGPG